MPDGNRPRPDDDAAVDDDAGWAHTGRHGNAGTSREGASLLWARFDWIWVEKAAAEGAVV